MLERGILQPVPKLIPRCNIVLIKELVIGIIHTIELELQFLADLSVGVVVGLVLGDEVNYSA
jgi:hypothetical protein